MEYPWLPLLLLTGLGAALRAWNLAAHPLWSDEFATLVFSLGHGFVGIPLDQVVSGDRLLESLRVTSGLGPGATLDRLLTESNHPPLYFVLSNLWIHLWQSPGTLVNLGVARSLPALLGTLAIPGMYALGRLIAPGGRHPFPWVAAGLMAVSPFGIYLSQETRHYTLGVLWAIASLTCWVWIVRHWAPTDEDREALPRWLPWVWLGINSLGITTHFFIGILLLGQAITLGILAWRWGFPPLRTRWTIAIAGLGTAATTLAWVPYAQSIPKAGLTDWLSETVTWTTGLKAIARLVAWSVTMGVLLPVENQPPVGVLIGSGLVMALATGAIGAGLIIVWRSQPQTSKANSPQILAFASLAVSLVGVILGIVLLLGKDITVAARYQFVTLPVVLVIMAAGWIGLAQRWPRTAIAWLLVAGISGGCVAQGLTFQRPDRPELMVDFIASVTEKRTDTASTLVATVYKNHEQTGEILGLAWEWRSHRTPAPQFLLATKAPDHPSPNDTLTAAIAPLPRPLDLWLVNFSAEENLRETNPCDQVPDTKHRVPGYSAKLYRCR